ncbi:MAG TPA: response regulator [Candidatus Paceibacterota bacterium]|nr:response regulator [Candidatus Paceibacterota bacterium]
MKKILIIEDDQIVANIYRNKFSLEGYGVEIALDGEAGLELSRTFRPDAIVLDLMLPKMSGVEVLKRLRSQPEFQALPVLVFSNTYLANMVQEAWKAGATKCLSKASCSPKQVIEAMKNMLANAQTAAAAPPSPEPEAPKAPAAPVSTPVNSESVPPPQPAREPSPTLTTQDADAEFQADLRSSFIEGLPGTLATLRGLLQMLVKAENEMVRLKVVQDLYRRIHALTGNAGLTGLGEIAQMSDALEALLKELYEKPKNINRSTLRTVALAIDFLGLLFDRGRLTDRAEQPQANILVVDDEPISRRAITYSLEKAKLKSVNVEDPQLAYTLLTENAFDLVFLDVDMPGMNGYELCAKLRKLAHHKKTPVVFVTSLTDFESRTNSTMSGGNDFIAKPFLFIELAVRALVYVLRGRLRPGQKPHKPAPAPCPAAAAAAA